MAEWFKALCLGLFLNRSGSESSQHYIKQKMIANPLQNLVGSNPTPLMSLQTCIRMLRFFFRLELS